MRDPKAYAKKVESYVEKYASGDDADKAGEGEDDEGGEGAVGNSPRNTRAPIAAAAASSAAASSGARNGNGASNGNGNGHAGRLHTGDDEEEVGNGNDDDDDDNMSDMGELSDGDEFMGEMDD